MFGLTVFQWVCIGLAVVVLLPTLVGNANVLGWLKSALSWFNRPLGTATTTTTTTAAALDDEADFKALKRLRERFVVKKCKEGLAAVDVATTHFFHGHGGEE